MEDSAQQLPPGQVCEELSAPLLRYLSRYVGDPMLAEDLLQESLIRIARGLTGFEGRSELKTWAFAIATRVAADHYRRRENRLAIVDVDESMSLQSPEEAADERLIVDEMSSCVRQVIDSLPEDYRTALVLHDLEHMTAAQTAQVCGCSLATAKIRIHRARMRLKDALTQQCDFYRCSDSTLRCDRKS